MKLKLVIKSWVLFFLFVLDASYGIHFVRVAILVLDCKLLLGIDDVKIVGQHHNIILKWKTKTYVDRCNALHTKKNT